jgi:hypothetical protein
MRKKQYIRLLFATSAMICFALGMGAKLLCRSLQYAFLMKLYAITVGLAVLIITIIFVEWIFSNKIYKGIKYFVLYVIVMNNLELQMIDAGLYIERGDILELPRIQLVFDEGLSKGILKIRNSLKFDKKLDDVVMSSALDKYVVESHYVTDDGNYYIYKLIDGSVDFKLTFKSYSEYLKYNAKIPCYSIFLDDRSVVKLQHTLIVGVTGSGKTYCLYNILLQFYNKNVSYKVYYADPKGSSLAVISVIDHRWDNSTCNISFIEQIRKNGFMGY